jgi:hypothetical protein
MALIPSTHHGTIGYSIHYWNVLSIESDLFDGFAPRSKVLNFFETSLHLTSLHPNPNIFKDMLTPRKYNPETVSTGMFKPHFRSSTSSC